MFLNVENIISYTWTASLVCFVCELTRIELIEYICHTLAVNKNVLVVCYTVKWDQLIIFKFKGKVSRSHAVEEYSIPL